MSIFLMEDAIYNPKNQSKVPCRLMIFSFVLILVTFFRDSLLLNIMALLITTIVRGLRTSSRPVPLWAAVVSNWVLQSRVGQIIVFHKLDPKVSFRLFLSLK